MAGAAAYFYRAPSVSRALLAEHLTPASRPALLELHDEFAALPWTREALAAQVKAAATRHRLKAGEVMMPLRMLVAGTPTTPAIDAVLALLGREAVRARMAAGLEA
jgi:glutamyl-tRNA synthetase